MASCLGQLFVWSLKNNVMVKDDTIGCHSYHDKGESVPYNEHPYYEEKQCYSESRGITWTPKNKRPEKLRDSLREADDLLVQLRCVCLKWRTRRILQVLLSNGCVITYMIKDQTGDVERVLIDKSLIGKLSGEVICDALLMPSYLVVSFPDASKLDYVFFTKKQFLGEAAWKLDKLSAWEPKIVTVDIPGPATRRLERRLASGANSDLILVWWPTSSHDACPWSPMIRDKEKANLVILSVNGLKMDIVSYTKTEYDLVHASFSSMQTHHVLTVEQVHGYAGGNTVEAATYKFTRTKIERFKIVSIPLQGKITCQSRHPSEGKLLLGCANGSLVMYDEHRLITYTTRTKLIPAYVSWHPTGTIAFVASLKGEIQVFDLALSPLSFKLVSENNEAESVLHVESFFRSLPMLQHMLWNDVTSELSADCSDLLLLSFNTGPLVLLQLQLGMVSREGLSALELIKEYIKHGQIDEAISLLVSMHWDVEGPSCYASLSAIVNHLLRMPLNVEREAQLEEALGTFYNTKEKPLSDATILEYRDPIRRLAKRFFCHLLRHCRLDKAFLLAVDIEESNLFMDIHYMALERREKPLAEAAKRKADQVEMELLDSLYDDYQGSFLVDSAQVPESGNRKAKCQDAASLKKSAQQQQNNSSLERKSHKGTTRRPASYSTIEEELIRDYTAALVGDSGWAVTAGPVHRSTSASLGYGSATITQKIERSQLSHNSNDSDSWLI